jgi:hypothetical protein
LISHIPGLISSPISRPRAWFYALIGGGHITALQLQHVTNSTSFYFPRTHKAYVSSMCYRTVFHGRDGSSVMAVRLERQTQRTPGFWYDVCPGNSFLTGPPAPRDRQRIWLDMGQTPRKACLNCRCRCGWEVVHVSRCQALGVQWLSLVVESRGIDADEIDRWD